MGACIKCGKETSNSYEYYTADQLKCEYLGTASESRGILQTPVQVSTTRYTYGNFERRWSHICTRCVRNIWYVILRYAVAVYLTLALGPFAIASIAMIATRKIDIAGGLIVGILAFAGVIGGWLWVYRARRSIKEDRYCNGWKNRPSRGTVKVINLMRKNNPRKAYFTPKEYWGLRRA